MSPIIFLIAGFVSAGLYGIMDWIMVKRLRSLGHDITMTGLWTRTLIPLLKLYRDHYRGDRRMMRVYYLSFVFMELCPVCWIIFAITASATW